MIMGPRDRRVPPPSDPTGSFGRPMATSGLAARFADLVMGTRPSFVLRQPIGDFVPRRLRAHPEVAFGSVARRLLEPAERNPDFVRIVVVGTDEVGAADLAEVFHDEFRRVVPSEELLAHEP